MSDLSGLIFLIVIGTSIWVWMDARSKAKNTADGRIAGNKPFAWFLGSLLLWIIAFPLYLVKRGESLGQFQNAPQDSHPNPVPELQGQDRARNEIQAKWESRTPEDLQEEARVLTDEYKRTHDNALVVRIQALRRAADERRRGKSEPKAIRPPQPNASRDPSKLAAYALMAVGGLIVVSWLFTKACINTPRVEEAIRRAKEKEAEEAAPRSWQNPTDQALLDAATTGFQGKEPEPEWVFRSDDPTFVKCMNKVSGVALYTPLWSAQLLGYNRRKEFGTAPVLAELTGDRIRHSASIMALYGSSGPDDQASLAVSVGGTLYRPTRIEPLKADIVSCDSEVTPNAWGLAIDAHFEGLGALPTSGKGTVTIRRDSHEDQQFDIDFDSIPQEAGNKEP